ncbi:hypothetical protein [Afipia clevelandensis]|uniref:Solute-binding protein family 3/N-terminal domain-containing protein n=1 Tax=Afipia clevelandensis ATCC 49720 TaxID=883079 RepID=K8NZ28_9BRAD|nr:hypothetical protein [Afipia clevelandensis]EKS32665.1 hypothetical protein HMPREF9696_03642 [Afipia clevelandensis ATCC 49720]
MSAFIKAFRFLFSLTFAFLLPLESFAGDLPTSSAAAEAGDSIFLARYFDASCDRTSCRTNDADAPQVGAIIAPKASMIGYPDSLVCNGSGKNKTKNYRVQAVVKSTTERMIQAFFAENPKSAELVAILKQHRVTFRASEVYREVTEAEPLMINAIASIPNYCLQKALSNLRATQFVSGRWFGLLSLGMQVENATAEQIKSFLPKHYSVAEQAVQSGTVDVTISGISPKLFAVQMGDVIPLVSRHQDIFGRIELNEKRRFRN